MPARDARVPYIGHAWRRPAAPDCNFMHGLGDTDSSDFAASRALASTSGCTRLLHVADEDEVQRIEAALRDEGWADHASLARQLRAWARLAAEVNTYAATVDDYTNDLCSRDYLAAVAARASSGLCRAIDEQVAPTDESFRQATVEDTDGRLGQYYRIGREDGWWWRRRPSSGPLADYLAVGD